jgi:hypothetical protein
MKQMKQSEKKRKKIILLKRKRRKTSLLLIYYMLYYYNKEKEMKRYNGGGRRMGGRERVRGMSHKSDTPLLQRDEAEYILPSENKRLQNMAQCAKRRKKLINKRNK